MPSVSKKQHNFMAAVAKNPSFAKKVGIKPSVGEEFLKADKGRKFKEGGAMMNKAMLGKKLTNEKDEMKRIRGEEMVDRAKLGMKKGGMAHSDMAKDKPMMKKVAAKAVKSHEKKLHGMAKGGGIEVKGKTKGTMVKMKKGGSC
jgi:phosphoserine phosphatase